MTNSCCRAKTRKVAEPAAAFGPAGSTGEQNISVIVAPIRDGFELQSLGAPKQAAQRFLDNTIAPLGSDLTAELISASERCTWFAFMLHAPCMLHDELPL